MGRHRPGRLWRWMSRRGGDAIGPWVDDFARHTRLGLSRLCPDHTRGREHEEGNPAKHHVRNLSTSGDGELAITRSSPARRPHLAGLMNPELNRSLVPRRSPALRGKRFQSRLSSGSSAGHALPARDRRVRERGSATVPTTCGMADAGAELHSLDATSTGRARRADRGRASGSSQRNRSPTTSATCASPIARGSNRDWLQM